MIFTRQDYQSELNLHDSWYKYDGPTNLQRILTFLVEVQWLPSQTTVNRALAHLQLPRMDGRTGKDDAREVRAAARRNYNTAAADADRIPLTRQELDEFASLSYSELQRRYFGEDGKASDFFSIRYRKAAREFGYRIPDKPAPAEEVDEVTGRLTAAEYYSIPARELQIKLRNPKFKLQVMQLIKSGAI